MTVGGLVFFGVFPPPTPPIKDGGGVNLIPIGDGGGVNLSGGDAAFVGGVTPLERCNEAGLGLDGGG